MNQSTPQEMYRKVIINNKNDMTKEEFISERTRIISNMLDNPNKYGIYPTTECFNELDALFDKITHDNLAALDSQTEEGKAVTDEEIFNEVVKGYESKEPSMPERDAHFIPYNPVNILTDFADWYYKKTSGYSISDVDIDKYLNSKQSEK